MKSKLEQVELELEGTCVKGRRIKQPKQLKHQLVIKMNPLSLIGLQNPSKHQYFITKTTIKGKKQIKQPKLGQENQRKTIK